MFFVDRCERVSDVDVARASASEDPVVDGFAANE